MAKAIKEIEKIKKNIDLFVIVVDARIPITSFNQQLKSILENKNIVFVFSKIDKANRNETEKWKKFFEKKYNTKVFLVDFKNNVSVSFFKKTFFSFVDQKYETLMILGIPNVGKSTLINNLKQKKVQKIRDLPGITRKLTWIKVNNFYVLDLPGIFPPKFNDENIWKLLMTNNLKREIIGNEEVANLIIDFLLKNAKSNLEKIYNIIIKNNENSQEIIEKICLEKKFLLKNDNLDVERASLQIIKDYDINAFGYFTLDK